MTTDPPTRPPDPASGALRFALTAGAWFIGLFGLMRLGWVERQLLVPFAQLQERVADQLTGAPTDAVYVDASCSGGDAMALCLGAVLAFPAPWSARLRGVGVGLLVIAAFNIVRIGNLSLVAVYPSLLDILHVYVWPAILILVAVAYVYAWMRRQMGPAVHGAGSDPGAAWHGPARRFLLLTVVGTAAYFAAAGWVYESALLRTLGGWVAMTSAGILAALGVSATASGNIVTTTHGAFIVTQECIATPLIPVYVAGALAVPFARWQRVAALGAAPAIFFLLGVARLLVLALPTTLIASHTVAIHAFSQMLVAGLLVAGLAGLSARSVGRPHPARRAVGAIGVGIVAAVVVGPLWSDLLHRAVDGGQLLVQHGGHRLVDDPQGAITILPALQLGLCARVLGGRRLAWALAATGSRDRGASRTAAHGRAGARRVVAPSGVRPPREPDPRLGRRCAAWRWSGCCGGRASLSHHLYPCRCTRCRSPAREPCPRRGVDAAYQEDPTRTTSVVRRGLDRTPHGESRQRLGVVAPRGPPGPQRRVPRTGNPPTLATARLKWVRGRVVKAKASVSTSFAKTKQ